MTTHAGRLHTLIPVFTEAEEWETQITGFYYLVNPNIHNSFKKNCIINSDLEMTRGSFHSQIWHCLPDNIFSNLCFNKVKSFHTNLCTTNKTVVLSIMMVVAAHQRRPRQVWVYTHQHIHTDSRLDGWCSLHFSDTHALHCCIRQSLNTQTHIYKKTQRVSFTNHTHVKSVTVNVMPFTKFGVLQLITVWLLLVTLSN